MSDGAGKYTRLIRAAMENLSRAFFDDYEKTNADFRARSGLKTIVIREEIGDCCPWCADIAGVYDYGDEPPEVWQRHENCRCMVVTRTEKGTYQDAWSRKEYQSYKEARIAREEEILNEQKEYAEKLRNNGFDIGVGKNVTAEYIENARPGAGKISFEEGFVKEENADEIAVGKWLHDTFGGDLLHINEHGKPDGNRQPDFLWRGKLWDLKTVSTEKAANSALHKGIDQTRKNPGGVILDYGEHNIDNIQLGEIVKKRIHWYPGIHIDVIIKKANCFSVIRF